MEAMSLLLIQVMIHKPCLSFIFPAFHRYTGNPVNMALDVHTACTMQ